MQTDHLRSHELLLPFLGIELVTIPLDRNIFGPLALTSNKPDTQRKKQTLLHKFSTLSRRTSRAKYLDQVKMPNRKYGLSVQKKPQGQNKILALYLFGIACDLSSPSSLLNFEVLLCWRGRKIKQLQGLGSSVYLVLDLAILSGVQNSGLP